MDIEFCMAFEDDALSEEELIVGFQKGIDSGLVWQLQGFYGRTARELIDAGYCHE